MSVVSSELKRLPHVWLHSAHCSSFRGAGGPSDPPAVVELKPLQLAGASSSYLGAAARKEKIEDLVQTSNTSSDGGFGEQTQQQAVWSEGLSVSLGNIDVVIESGVHEVLRIPLLLTDVVAALLPTDKGDRYVVALAPRPERPPPAVGPPESAITESRPLDPSLQDVWMFFLDGSLHNLKQFLFDLSGRGALRWDMHECYSVVQKPLGEGGCGQVYLGQSLLGARNKSEGVLGISQVAIKVLRHDPKKPQEDLMRSEIGFLARAREHPNITSLYGVFCACHKQGKESQEKAGEERQGSKKNPNVSWFIVMQLASSGDLFDYVQAGTLDNTGCLALMNGLFSALKHLHSLKIIHRDVKPENVLLDANCKPMLADMGIAAYLDDAIEMTRVRGTPGYAAPEVVSNQPYDELADIFSAGVVYYYAVTCRQPFFAENRHETLHLTAQCKVRYPRKYFQHVSTGTLNLVKFCMSKDPKKRPSSKQSLQALQTIVRQTSRSAASSDPEAREAAFASFASTAFSQHQRQNSGVEDAFLREMKFAQDEVEAANAFLREMRQQGSSSQPQQASSGGDGGRAVTPSTASEPRRQGPSRPDERLVGEASQPIAGPSTRARDAPSGISAVAAVVSEASSSSTPDSSTRRPLRAVPFGRAEEQISQPADRRPEKPGDGAEARSMPQDEPATRIVPPPAAPPSLPPSLSSASGAEEPEASSRQASSRVGAETEASSRNGARPSGNSVPNNQELVASPPVNPDRPLEPRAPAAEMPRSPRSLFRFGRRRAGAQAKQDDDAAAPSDKPPAQADEQPGTGSTSSKSKKSMYNMPWRASRWVAGVFHKTPAPSAEEQGSGASSSTSAIVPKPPQEPPPARTSARGRVASRP